MQTTNTISGAQQKGAMQAPSKLYIEDQIGFVELLEVFGSDLTVVNAARVSFNKESEFEPIMQGLGAEQTVTGYRLAERDQVLIRYLAQHRHITPFFHPILRFRIKMPIFVVREWYRHSVGFARNEVSRRYVMEEPQCFVPSPLRKRDKNIKQGSSDELVENNDLFVEHMRVQGQQACLMYQELLDAGVCPEQARAILPQSMYTEFIETASLAAYARLAVLRLDSTAQKEIRVYAQYVSDLVAPHFPVSWKVLMEVGKGMLG